MTISRSQVDVSHQQAVPRHIAMIIRLRIQVTLFCNLTTSPWEQGALITSKATGAFDAGDITNDGRIVMANSGAEIDASNSGSGDAGTVLIDVDDRDNASITLNGAIIRGGNVTLDADAAFTPGGVYDDPTANANARSDFE